MEEKKEQQISLRKDIKNQWGQILKDYDYCVNFISVRYPVIGSKINKIAELHQEEENSLKEKISNIILKYPDIEDIAMNFNYGLFQQIAKKHNTSPWFVKDTFREISVEEGQGVGLLLNKNHCIYEVIIPEPEILLDKYEKPLAYICEEDVHFTNQVPKEFYMKLPGFTEKEKQEFERTVLKIWHIRMNVCVKIAAIVINRLAIAHNDGKIAEEKNRSNNKNKSLWRLNRGELLINKLEVKYAPTRMNLTELLLFITRSINETTKEMREFKDFIRLGVDIHEKKFCEKLKKISPEELALPIPPLTIEEVQEIFIVEKMKLLVGEKICLN